MPCSCTGNCDLINIEPIVLSDTFHTWYDRTNEVIDTLNNVQVYEVRVGTTDGGLTALSSCVNNNYNGVITLKVDPGPGIGVGTILSPDYYLNHTMIDVSGMTTFGPTGYSENLVSAFPAEDDYYIFSDVSDSTLASGAGTPKRIRARQILPPTVYLPDNFEFKGTVQIDGDLIVSGLQSVVDSNEVLIEDKAIELAYRRFVSVDVTGPTSSLFPLAGMTFRYYDSTNSVTGSPSTIGKISEVNFIGTTTNLKLHSFTLGGVSDIDAGGRLSITGTIFDFTMVAGPTTSTSFYSDDLLDESGIIVKGASGDKSLLWVYKEGPSQDLYNAFISSSNLGVSGSSNSVIASKFRSYGYADSNDNNIFQFMAYTNGKPKIIIGGSTGSNTYSDFGYWTIQHDNTGVSGATQQPLIWGFKSKSSGSESEKFRIYSGASGPTYDTISVTGQSNNRVTNFAQGLNVDFLDGAHGTTMPTAWSIPVALTDGTIHPDWIPPTALKALVNCFNQPGHAYVVGDAVRINVDDGGLTYSYSATSKEYAETLGIVSSVDGNEVCVTSKGWVFGLTGPAGSRIADIYPLVTGHVYFLSANTNKPGSLTKDPDIDAYPVTIDKVLKPMLLATGYNSGYVVNYLGVIRSENVSDIVEVQGLMPVGMIMPYARPTSDIPYGWKLCDGSRLLASDWGELYGAIAQKYYIGGKVSSFSDVSGVTLRVTISLDTKETHDLVVNDLLNLEITYPDGTVVGRNGKVVSITNVGVLVAEIELPQFPSTVTGGTVKIRGRRGSGGNGIFFLPDLRGRAAVGATKGLSGQFAPDIDLGDIGGLTSVTLGDRNIPQHYHKLNPVGLQSGGDTYGVAFDQQTGYNVDTAYYTSDGPANSTTGLPSPFNILQPYTAINWIIRAKKGLSALILTGHNHDDRYHPLHGNMRITSQSFPLTSPGTGLPLETRDLWYETGFSGFNVYGAPSTLDEVYPPNGQTAWILSVVSDQERSGFASDTDSESTSEVLVAGDFSVYGNGISGGLGEAGDRIQHKSRTFKVNSLLNEVLIGGQSYTTDRRKFDPSLKFYSNSGFLGGGKIIGLTAPSFSVLRTEDNYAVNKFYSDTSAKVIYNSLPSGENSASLTRPTGQFNVVVAAGVVSPGEKSIMSVVADTTPSGVGAKTEVHVRGDLNAWGNNITGQEGANTLTAHNLETFGVYTLKNEVRILGGWTFANQDQQYPPKLSLWNRKPEVVGPNAEPIGIVDGLTAPTISHQAANKWYVDQQVQEIPVIPLATTSITGVAFYDNEFFEVSNQGKVSLIGVGDLKIKQLTTEFPTVLPTTGIPGVRISTTNDLLEGGSRFVFMAAARDSQGVNIGTNSNHEVNIGGDFTVWGDAHGHDSFRAHSGAVFAVNPLVNTVVISGGYNGDWANGNLQSDGSSNKTPAPSLVFSDDRGGDRGTISGLTACTQDSEAANKWYVDQNTSLWKNKPDYFYDVYKYAPYHSDQGSDDDSGDDVYSVASGDLGWVGQPYPPFDTRNTQSYESRTAEQTNSKFGSASQPDPGLYMIEITYLPKAINPLSSGVLSYWEVYPTSNGNIPPNGGAPVLSSDPNAVRSSHIRYRRSSVTHPDGTVVRDNQYEGPNSGLKIVYATVRIPNSANRGLRLWVRTLNYATGTPITSGFIDNGRSLSLYTVAMWKIKD